MTPEMLGIYGIVAVLVAMMLLKVPPGFAMAIVGFIGFALATSFSAATVVLVTELWDSFSKSSLMVIPMFILVGELIYYAGYSDHLFSAAYKWFGHFRGGQAITSIFACAGFSSICGSNTATAATMSAVAIPSMRKYNYHPTLMAGSVAAGSTLGVMIPPSIVLVVYGLYAQQSIAKLFIGVLIPGIILTLLFAVTVMAICWRHPEWGPRGERSGWPAKLRSILPIIDVLILFVVIMYAMFAGLMTATEAAAASCFLGMVMCLGRSKLTWGKFKSSVSDTLRISCMVFMIVAGAYIFGRFMAVTRLPYEAAEAIGALSWPNWAVLLMMLLIFVIGGCLMDALAFLLVSLPIFMPIVLKMHYDPVWFGVLLCLVTTLGAITPPVGISCFVVASMHKDIPMEQVFKGAMYYLPAYILTGVLLILFPYWTVLMLASRVR